jgi:radical SAM superfamily enzyme YgiQ (UPF0313 family)
LLIRARERSPIARGTERKSVRMWRQFRSRFDDVLARVSGAVRGAAAPHDRATDASASGRADDRLAARLRLCPAQIVIVTAHGPRCVSLPEPLQHAGLPILALIEELSRPEARPLRAALAAAADRSGADAAHVEHMAAALQAAGLLTADPDDRSARAADACIAPAGASPGAKLTVRLPATLVVEGGAFLWFDHDGALRDRLRAEEVDALRAFIPARTVDEAFASYVQSTDRARLDRTAFSALAERLWAKRLMVEADTVRSRRADPVPFVVGAAAAAMQSRFVEFIAARAPAPGGTSRIPVVPVHTSPNVRPLSLGLLVAHAAAYDGGRLQAAYDFVPLFFCEEAHLAERARTPSIFLFSNYMWNLEENLRLSALVKHINPENVTIHGGPSTPKYAEDAARYFAEHPHVDVAVRGEGEATFAALLAALDPTRPAQLEALADVAGLTFRHRGQALRTPDRERIGDLDTIPSPYLAGLFEPFGSATGGAIIETNRGCPYGCTFCDWGSATLSKIRLFSLDRVFAELEWSASRHIEVCALADANFGIIDRDVLIAEKIAELKRRYGYPMILATNYAKNTVKHLRKIIEILADVKVLTEGVVSLQSMDRHTLHTIRRSNIKLEQYDALTTEFRRAGIPLAADILMGLPGATPAAFRNDLQQCVNRDVTARVNPTQLLPNSPMNEPSYRREHGITAGHGEIIKETASYTREEWEEMARLREAFSLFDTWGVLRYVACFVRQETGIGEVEFYDRLQRAARHEAHWPFLRTTLRVVPEIMSPPGSWALFLDEVRRFLVERLGVRDQEALRTVLAVQAAHLPAPDRTFPFRLALSHDFAAWYRAIHDAREEGHRDDWETVVRPLRDHPPAELVIDDPHDICRVDVGKPMGLLSFAMQSWEFDSPVSRPRMRTLSGFAAPPASATPAAAVQ